MPIYFWRKRAYICINIKQNTSTTMTRRQSANRNSRRFTWSQINTRVFFIGGFTTMQCANLIEKLNNYYGVSNWDDLTWNEINEALHAQGWSVKRLLNLSNLLGRKNDNLVFTHDGIEFHS